MKVLGNMFVFNAVFIIWLHSVSAQNNVSEEVDYYEELINTNMENAFTYDLPVNAEEFKPKQDSLPQYYGTFDFIIIGSGSAGATIANRLSEVSEWNVLVLEAGGNETDFSEIPRTLSYLQGLRYNWNFNLTKQTGCCLGNVNQMCPLPRGKVLGGSSSINGMVYSRGNRLDYDEWAALGNQGWSYQEVLPYFIKSENSQIRGDLCYHGKNGYWNVDYAINSSKQFDPFIEANRELYNYTSTDYNGEEQLGMFYIQANTLNGRRDSTAKAFLRPVEGRNNLKILMHSYAMKILIRRLSKTVYGVVFSRNNKLYFAKVRKEVIVSAGAIQSPQLLMLSGIGPKEELRNHGIPVIQDLSVGKNFQEHIAYYGLYVQTNLIQSQEALNESIEEYLNGTGPLTVPGDTPGLGFYESSYSRTPGLPDLELLFFAPYLSNSFWQRRIHATDEITKELWSKIDPERCFNVLTAVLHPKSIGAIKLQSKDPFQYPLLDLQLFSDSEGRDINTMYEAVQILEELLKTNAMRQINATIVYPDFQQCRDFEKGSKNYWYCAFRLLSGPVYHPVSSCKMGNDPEKGAVVDNKLKVYGIKGLRVADASVIPLPVSGHTSAPTVMIGEKVSDIIKLHYNKPIEPITNAICN